MKGMKKILELKDLFFRLKSEIDANIEGVDTDAATYIQNYLYFMHYPLFSFAESIILLCLNNKAVSASVLLRSMFEAHINIQYHLLDDTEHRLALSAKGGFDTKIKGIQQVRKMISRNPNLESTDSKSLFSKTWLDEAETWASRKRKDIIDLNHLTEKDVELDLKSKAIKCDEVKATGAEPGHFERMYTIIYRQLSPAAHFGVEGLQMFVKEDADKYLFYESVDGDFIVSQAIDICVAFVKDLYETKVFKGEVPKIIAELEAINVRN